MAKHHTQMSHILRVKILVCGGLEASHEVGFFLADQVETAIECAKAHIDPNEATMVEMIPLGELNVYGDHKHPTPLWVHDPEKCDNTCTCGARELNREQSAAEHTANTQ